MSIGDGFAALAVDSLTVALGSSGRAVSAVVPVTGVSRSGSVLRGRVTFGPYTSRVDASEVLVWVAGEGPAVAARLVGGLGLPVGMPFDFDLELDVAVT